MGRSVMKIQRTIMIGLLLGVLGTGLWRDPAAAQGDTVGEVIQLVNQFRAENGLSPLVMDGSLMAAAQNHANWIIATGQYGHSGEGGSTPQDRARAAGYTGIAYENYVYGTALTPSQAVQWWKNSAIHRATMLLSRGEQVGLGYVGGESNLYVLVVGHPTPPPPTRAPNASSGQGNSAAAEEEPAEEEDPGPVVVPITLAEPDENGTVTHVVQQGQTAWAIAARYEVDLDGMLAINGLVRPAVLKPGDRVIVRLGEGQAPPPTPTPLLNYMVQAGETIWEIAVRNGLTVDELLALNGLTRQDVLLPGTELRLRDPGEIPTPVPTDTPPPPTATPDQAAIAATAAADAFAAAPSPAAPNTTPDATPTTAPDLSPSAPPPTRDSSGGPPTLPPPGSADSVPAPPVTPEAVTATAPPTAPTTAQAVAALPGSGVVVSAPPASNPPAARRADDSGPDRAVIVGVIALGAVWIMVGAAVVWSWMQNRRGR